MKAIELLLNNYWIVKQTDREAYYMVKHEINDKNVKKFIQDRLGWKLIHTENFLKLEKIPAHAESFMGIQSFTEVRDYCFLCGVLMFLEDKEENNQFLLSELIRYIETVMMEYMDVDWTSFAQRKSLVRCLQYAEEAGLLKTYEGNSGSYASEKNSEVLYENTGLSRYFCTSFSMDITNMQSWHDFEKKQIEELDEEHGNLRTNRVYRQLISSPSMYWQDPNSADAMYVKTQRSTISRTVDDAVGGKLIVHKNSAAIIFEDSLPVGAYHPTTSMLSEIVLLVCHTIYEMAQDARRITLKEDDTIVISDNRFKDILLNIKKKYQALWSKEFREMGNEKYIFLIKEYMKKWLMLKEEEGQIILYPVCAITTGRYSESMEDKIDG